MTPEACDDIKESIDFINQFMTPDREPVIDEAIRMVINLYPSFGVPSSMKRLIGGIAIDYYDHHKESGSSYRFFWDGTKDAKLASVRDLIAERSQ
jgi:hypothetical protein